MAFKALAYIGLAFLDDVGTFDNHKAAQKALETELEKMCEGMDTDDKEAFEEAFWANSQIDTIPE